MVAQNVKDKKAGILEKEKSKLEDAFSVLKREKYVPADYKQAMATLAAFHPRHKNRQAGFWLTGMGGGKMIKAEVEKAGKDRIATLDKELEKLDDIETPYLLARKLLLSKPFSEMACFAEKPRLVIEQKYLDPKNKDKVRWIRR